MDDFFTKLQPTVSEIPESRLPLLNKLADFVAGSATSSCNLVFICTHNSRRSHLGQALAAAAASFVGLENVTTYSAGTEVTAFNANAINALVGHGCAVDVCTDRDQLAALVGTEVASTINVQDPSNPVYLVRHTPGQAPSICFSKTLSHPSLPSKNFAAIMTCTSADAACPVVAGAAKRIALPYTDPKASDGTGNEGEVYGAKCEEIGREMLYVMSEANRRNSL